ncbi:hypothetical protein RJT34_31526 [Clitoria ternatea]|uniref:Uncharacterized protein n=1 Tax=Clitoria ternatea TaxID=43366 RepID=A0AAN9EUG0_CLITE
MEASMVVVEFKLKELKGALDGDGTIGSCHGGGYGRGMKVVEFLEEFENSEEGFRNGDGGQVMLKGLKEKVFFEAKIGV